MQLRHAHFAWAIYQWCCILEEAMPTSAPTDIGQLISFLYSTAQGLVGVSAFVLLVYAGFNILTHPGDKQALSHAKEIAVNCALGIILLFSAVFILRAIAGDQYVRGTQSIFPAPGEKLPTK